LLALVEHENSRVRRAAATGLGKAGGPGVEAALLAGFERADLPERRARVEALGKVGGEESRRFLGALSSDDAELERRRTRSLVMLSRSVGRELGTLELDRPLPSTARLVLLCRRGLGAVLAEEARSSGLPEPLDSTASELALAWAGPLRPLLSLRVALEVGIEIPIAGASESRVLAALREVTPLLAVLGSGVPRFRLAWGKQRARTFRIAEALDPCLLVNDPRGALWEARVEERRLLVVARPDVDPRFEYRGRDVPAASHPSVAAALARVAGVRADDVVWDPFVGSGLELCERGLLGPFARLVGTDTSERALDAARVNLRRAGLGAELSCADATRFPASGVTLLITNPPMGRRVARGELAGLLARFVDHAARCLAPGARWVWLSPLPVETARALSARGLRVERRGAVDLGGFDAELQVAFTSPASGAKMPPP